MCNTWDTEQHSWGLHAQKDEAVSGLCPLFPEAPSGATTVYWLGAPTLGSGKPGFPYSL